ncbi:MAG: hypothetical protein ACK2T3_08085, partial [Candidatus Promineifilaceae bacterium]
HCRLRRYMPPTMVLSINKAHPMIHIGVQGLGFVPTEGRKLTPAQPIEVLNSVSPIIANPK